MNRQDVSTRKTTTAIVLAVGLFAGGDSYAHVFSLARSHGQDVLSAALLPLAGDGVIAAASAVMLVASRQDRPIPLRARVMLLAGIAATIAANVAYGLPHGHTDALLSVWPVAAYVGCMELLTWMRQNTGMHPARIRPASVPVPPGASGDASKGAPDDLRERREHKTVDLLTAAEKAFPGARNGGKVPPLRDIQTVLSVGQPKAQKVQQHFRALQMAT